MKKSYLLLIAIIAMAFTTTGCNNSCKAESSTSTTTVTLLDGVTTSWDGVDLIDYPEGEASITLLKITVPPMCKLPLHYHPVINVGYMLEGSLTVTDDKGNTMAINAGNPIVETVNTIHYGENKGTTDAVILVFYAGEQDEVVTEISDTYPKTEE
ncbi:MAG: cupin domain-containing protein [Rikenellaceae bacterium]